MDREFELSHRNIRQRESPSFSSTLLDAIYRSIDDDHGGDEELVLYHQTMKKKHYSSFAAVHGNGDFGDNDRQALDNLRRACLIDKWMEKKVSEKVVVRRKSTADFERRSRDDSLFLKSSSSSSDSSCAGGFSSSEAESVPSRPKPIRTSLLASKPAKFNKHEKQQNAADAFGNHYQQHDNIYAPSTQQKPKHEGGFVKTKSRALKIYGDLKKVKQPISPGGKLATFLNSLFTAGNVKKAKISSSRGSYDEACSNLERKSKSAHASTCSSASSFSRSCLSNTPSSRGKLSNGIKRSVRFYPVSVIVDEDCQPCGHKSLCNEESNLQAAVKFVRKNDMSEELKVHLSEKNRGVEEAARDLLKNYQKKVECEFDLRNEVDMDIDEEDDDEDEDAASYASSDLFELDNLSAIGMERYREELPVYGTTLFDTNRGMLMA